MADAPSPSNSAAATGGVPTVATTITVPPTSPAVHAGVHEGGEWELLVTKVREWFASGQAAAFWAQTRTPLVALAVLVGLLMLLRVYTALIEAIDSIPLLSGLLELVGVIWVLGYGVPRLARSSDRLHLLDGLIRSWNGFLGR